MRRKILVSLVVCLFALGCLGGPVFVQPFAEGSFEPPGLAKKDLGPAADVEVEEDGGVENDTVAKHVYHPSLKGLLVAWAKLEQHQFRHQFNERVCQELIRICESLECSPGDMQSYARLNALRAEMGDEALRVFVRGRELESEVEPQIFKGRTVLPLRALGESIGVSFDWDPETKTVTFELNGQVVVLVVNDRVALVNGTEVQLDVPAKVSNGRVLVPARFVSEAMNCEVRFLANPALVIILPKADAGDEAEAGAEEETEDEAEAEAEQEEADKK